MSCDRLNQIHAYHDGELSPVVRMELESHLAVCTECRELLEELQDLSSLLGTAELPELPSGAMNRMRGAWWASKPAQDRGIRRLTGWLTAAAAAVLMVVPMLPTRNPPSDQQLTATRSFEIMALVPPAGPADDSSSELLEVARWFASDLSTEQGQ